MRCIYILISGLAYFLESRVSETDIVMDNITYR